MGSVKSVLLLAVVVGACSNTLSPGFIEGKWAQEFSYPGSAFEMQLTTNGGTISGSGDWCAEAGPCGTVAVTGTIKGNAVHLDQTFTPTMVPGISGPSLQHFDGRFTSLRLLEGTLSVDRPGQPPLVIGQVRYHRE
jgi:hypothetical protein